MPWAVVCGIHGNLPALRAVLADRARMAVSDRHAAERLSPAVMHWLPAAPALAPGPHAVHGSPFSDVEYRLPTVDADGLREARDDEVAERLGGGFAPGTLLRGHSHLPRDRVVAGVRVVDPGGVGLPAFDHDEPFPHVAETGRPHARAQPPRSASHWPSP